MSFTAMFPSEPLPAIPGFAFDLPPGWTTTDFAGSLGALTSPAADEDLWINIQIRHRRVDGGVTLEAAAMSTWLAFITSFNRATKDMEREGMYGGKNCYLRSAYLNLPDVDANLMQIDALFFAPPGPNRTTVDLFHLVGSVDEERLREFTDSFLTVTKSFTFTT